MLLNQNGFSNETDNRVGVVHSEYRCNAVRSLNAAMAEPPVLRFSD